MDPTFLILAAGLGTRMKSKMAKVLHRAGGLALVEHVVRAALGVTSPDRIVVVVGYQADQVRAALQRYGVRFASQSEPKGTGHAVLCCRDAACDAGGPVVVAYGDCPLLTSATFRSLIEQQVNSTKAATLITTRLDDPTGYGRVVLDSADDVEAIVEQKAATPQQLLIQTINSGIYCFRSDLLWKYIGEIQPNAASGEYYLTDLPEILGRDGYKVGAFHLEDPTQLLGINTRVELAAADRILRERKNTELMLAGVTIEKPETVIVDPDVEIGNDTIVEAFARILGRSHVGSACRVGSCSIISNSELADSVEIHAFTHIDTARVESGASVGPFGRLRPNAHIETGAHVGNFVELKNTRLGAGSKSMHLAYLGDSQIGEDVNIGAGTITCNYDGLKKHRTAIGKNSFVGSNSTLVAPIEIGEDAYIAAGSVITEPVPDGTLALGRSRQVMKEGWVARRKAKLKAST